MEGMKRGEPRGRRSRAEEGEGTESESKERGALYHPIKRGVWVLCLELDPPLGERPGTLARRRFFISFPLPPSLSFSLSLLHPSPARFSPFVLVRPLHFSTPALVPFLVFSPHLCRTTASVFTTFVPLFLQLRSTRLHKVSTLLDINGTPPRRPVGPFYGDFLFPQARLRCGLGPLPSFATCPSSFFPFLHARLVLVLCFSANAICLDLLARSFSFALRRANGPFRDAAFPASSRLRARIQ